MFLVVDDCVYNAALSDEDGEMKLVVQKIAADGSLLSDLTCEYDLSKYEFFGVEDVYVESIFSLSCQQTTDEPYLHLCITKKVVATTEEVYNPFAVLFGRSDSLSLNFKETTPDKLSKNIAEVVYMNMLTRTMDEALDDEDIELMEELRKIAAGQLQLDFKEKPIDVRIANAFENYVEMCKKKPSENWKENLSFVLQTPPPADYEVDANCYLSWLDMSIIFAVRNKIEPAKNDNVEGCDTWDVDDLDMLYVLTSIGMYTKKDRKDVPKFWLSQCSRKRCAKPKQPVVAKSDRAAQKERTKPKKQPVVAKSDVAAQADTESDEVQNESDEEITTVMGEPVPRKRASKRKLFQDSDNETYEPVPASQLHRLADAAAAYPFPDSEADNGALVQAEPEARALPQTLDSYEPVSPRDPPPPLAPESRLPSPVEENDAPVVVAQAVPAPAPVTAPAAAQNSFIDLTGDD